MTFFFFSPKIKHTVFCYVFYKGVLAVLMENNVLMRYNCSVCAIKEGKQQFKK